MLGSLLTLASCVQTCKTDPAPEGNYDSQRARSCLSFCSDKEPRSKLLSTAIGLACLGSLMFLAACATSDSYGRGPAASGEFRSAPISDGAFEAKRADAGELDSEALESLWKSRVAEVSGDATPPDFTLGPGDLLRISVPQIDQLKDRAVRVSEHNTIALPLLGVISVIGMSEQDLRNDLSSRLTKYMYHPQVEVFLLRAENRQVAVLGSVKTPGRYMLASRSDTIMTMISRAGGMSQDAASRIILIPALTTGGRGDLLPGAVAHAERIPPGIAPVYSASDEFEAAGSPGSGVSGVSLGRPVESDTLARKAPAERLVISMSHSEDQHYLELPAQPGDVIIIPAAGEVSVQGWVDKPGSFKITNGMTALSSIGAAGGALFTGSATLIREQSNGGKLEIPLDLAKITHGEEPDISVQGGDVVVVERSVVGAVPYSLYYIISRVGLGVPIPF